MRGDNVRDQGAGIRDQGKTKNWLLKGLCQCGCGGRTNPARCNDKSKGWIKGIPIKFLPKLSGSITPKKLPRSVPSGALIKTGRNFWLFAIVESLARGALSNN